MPRDMRNYVNSLKTSLSAAIVALCLLCSLPAIAQPPGTGEKAFNAQSFTLDNGLQVVVIPNHRAPVVNHMVWYKVGSADEEPGRSGLAHYVEHLMFKGSENVPPGAFSRRVRALGGNDNAFTGPDYTAYHQSIAVDHLETVMAMEADRMRGLLFPPDEVASERLVVIEERRERTENDPRAYFGEQLRAALFINHPYGNPVIGWYHELDALDRDLVIEFYERWYAPNNAILIVAGDITAEQLRPLAEKYYGTIPAKELPARHWTAVPPLPASARLTLNHPEIRQPSLSRMYRVPSFSQNREESLALQVLQNIMDGSAATRLYRRLVVEDGLATNVSFGYGTARLSDSTLWLGAVPADGIELETLEEALDDELRHLIAAGVSDQELAEAIARMIDQSIYERDSLSGPAMIFGRVLTTGGTIDDVEYWTDHIAQVTAEQVHDVARRYLDPDKIDMRPYVTGYLLPARPAQETTNEEEAAE